MFVWAPLRRRPGQARARQGRRPSISGIGSITLSCSTHCYCNCERTCKFITDSRITKPFTKKKVRLEERRRGEDPQVRAGVEVGRLFGEDRAPLLDEK